MLQRLTFAASAQHSPRVAHIRHQQPLTHQHRRHGRAAVITAIVDVLQQRGHVAQGVGTGTVCVGRVAAGLGL